MKRNLEDRRAKASHMLLLYVMNLLISMIQAFIFSNIVICDFFDKVVWHKNRKKSDKIVVKQVDYASTLIWSYLCVVGNVATIC